MARAGRLPPPARALACLRCRDPDRPVRTQCRRCWRRPVLRRCWGGGAILGACRICGGRPLRTALGEDTCLRALPTEMGIAMANPLEASKDPQAEATWPELFQEEVRRVPDDSAVVSRA